MGISTSATRFSNYALDNFVAQELSLLTTCDAPDLSKQFDSAEHWVQNFILRSMLIEPLAPKFRPHLFGILRRAQMALAEYEAGRRTLVEYLTGPKERVSMYFRALYHFEIVVALTYQAYHFFFTITKDRMFTQGENTPLERLGRIYNVSKHLEESTLSDAHLHSVWLANAGIKVSTCLLSWLELADLLEGIGLLADTLVNPDKYRSASNLEKGAAAQPDKPSGSQDS